MKIQVRNTLSMMAKFIMAAQSELAQMTSECIHSASDVNKVSFQTPQFIFIFSLLVLFFWNLNIFIYLAGYIFAMATISADVTKQMIKWADKKVRNGLYKSRSEVIREMFREKMSFERYSLWSEKSLERVW